jgi:hypothetical protein
VQLDQTRIAIRERDLLDILDLAGRVTACYARPWLVASLLGALPLAVLNWWLLGDFVDYAERDDVWLYAWRMIALVVVELPLASAPLTLYLGQAMFLEQPSWRKVAVDWWRSLGQLLWYQVVWRGLFLIWPLVSNVLAFLVLLWPLPFAIAPYRGEIILLERNPFRGGEGVLSTGSRSKALHSGAGGDLFARWLGATVLAAMMWIGLWLSLWYLASFVTGRLDFGPSFSVVLLPLSLWTVASFFTVVRFLAYLDLRIRREGWEVELTMRAESARLAGRAT